MEAKIKRAVETYQCPGCVCGCDITRYEGDGGECTKHVPGTIANYGTFFLGMPKGFNRLGLNKETKINIFNKLSDFSYDRFNVPVWKYLDENGNTLVRGMQPRWNFPFLHIFLEDCSERIGGIEITKEDIEQID